MAASNNEFVKRGGVKKQRLYLNDNLKNLHKKYCKEQGILVSYSVFCKYRPFWVVFPKKERDTTQYKVSTNFNLLVEGLKSSNIISEGSAADALNNLCCDAYSENYLARSCDVCKNKNLDYKEFDNSTDIYYFEWIVEKQHYRGKDGKQKVKTVSTKKKQEDKHYKKVGKQDATFL